MDAQINLGRFLILKGDLDLDEAQHCLQPAADQGNAVAQCHLGCLFEKRNYLDEAIKWLRKAADQYNNTAKSKLSALLQKKSSAETLCRQAYLSVLFNDFNDAKDRYLKSAQLGLVDAQYQLGLLFKNEGNLVEAINWCTKAADQGHAGAKNLLDELSFTKTFAECLHEEALSDETKGKLVEAKEYYLQSAELGLAEAQFNLGYLLEEDRDLIAAKNWYSKAANQGHVLAQIYLGNLFIQEGDFAAAEIWYRKAAEKGNSNAQCTLGWILQKNGDLATGEIWYRKSADQGFVPALFNLGCLLQEKGDLAAAENCYRQAADQGHEEAQNNLLLLQTTSCARRRLMNPSFSF